MTDPRRWLEDPEALDEQELRALRAGRDAEPSTATRQQVWSALAMRLPGGGAGDPGGAASGSGSEGAGTAGSGVSGTSVAGTSASGAGLSSVAPGASGASTLATVGASSVLKAVAVGALAGGVVMGGLALTRTLLPEAPTRLEPARAPAPSTTARPHAMPGPVRTESDSARAVSSTARPIAPSRTRAAERLSPPGGRAVDGGRVIARDAQQASAAPSFVAAFPRPEDGADAESANDADTPTTKTDALAAAREESAIVARARERLRAGDVAGSLRELESARRRFPRGILVQEREALGVEALARAGQRARARTSAQAFLRAYPNSPYAARVREAVGLQ